MAGLMVSMDLKITTFADIRKMTVRVGLALCVMLAMALGGSKIIKWKTLRSLVKAV